MLQLLLFFKLHDVKVLYYNYQRKIISEFVTSVAPDEIR